VRALCRQRFIQTDSPARVSLEKTGARKVSE
jgi:hypothetical protein